MAPSFVFLVRQNPLACPGHGVRDTVPMAVEADRSRQPPAEFLHLPCFQLGQVCPDLLRTLGCLRGIPRFVELPHQPPQVVARDGTRWFRIGSMPSVGETLLGMITWPSHSSIFILAHALLQLVHAEELVPRCGFSLGICADHAFQKLPVSLRLCHDLGFWGHHVMSLLCAIRRALALRPGFYGESIQEA